MVFCWRHQNCSFLHLVNFWPFQLLHSFFNDVLTSVPKRGKCLIQRIHSICCELHKGYQTLIRKKRSLCCEEIAKIWEAAFWTKCHITWHISLACRYCESASFHVTFPRLVRVTQDWKAEQDEGIKGRITFYFCLHYSLSCNDLGSEKEGFSLSFI